jgi:excisionase family DNA binding protein
MARTLEPPTLASADQARLAELGGLLSAGTRPAGKGNRHRLELSEDHFQLLCRILDNLANGKALDIASPTQHRTTQQAADFPGGSRQYFVRLLDEWQLPFHRVGTHGRVRPQDLLSFRSERDPLRHSAIQQMVLDAIADGVCYGF